jgi:hypothetical protein
LFKTSSMALLPTLWLFLRMFALPSSNLSLSISLSSSFCCERKRSKRLRTKPSISCFHFYLIMRSYSSCLLTFSGEPFLPKYIDCCCFGLGLYFTYKVPYNWSTSSNNFSRKGTPLSSYFITFSATSFNKRPKLKFNKGFSKKRAFKKFPIEMAVETLSLTWRVSHANKYSECDRGEWRRCCMRSYAGIEGNRGTKGKKF